MGTKYGVLWCMVAQETWLDVKDKAGEQEIAHGCTQKCVGWERVPWKIKKRR